MRLYVATYTRTVVLMAPDDVAAKRLAAEVEGDVDDDMTSDVEVNPMKVLKGGNGARRPILPGDWCKRGLVYHAGTEDISVADALKRCVFD